eukprot:1694642-Rhodomonas_salina.1
MLLRGAGIGDYDFRTALHLAASNERVSVVEYLLTLDSPPVDPNRLDRFGGTALDDAIRHGATTATALLRKHGGVQSSGHSDQLEKQLAANLRETRVDFPEEGAGGAGQGGAPAARHGLPHVIPPYPTLSCTPNPRR